MTIKEGKELLLHYLLPNFRSFDTKAKTSGHNFCQGQTPIISISLILFGIYANERFMIHATLMRVSFRHLPCILRKIPTWLIDWLIQSPECS